MTRAATAFSQTHEAIGRRAADYFQRQRLWGWSEADQAELDAWLAESDLHRVAFLRVEWSVTRTGQLAALRPPKRGVTPKGEAARADGKRGRGWVVLPLLAAASIALGVTFGLPLLRAFMEPPDRTYSTDVGGLTLLKFPDHTQIELNTDTVVRYRMTSDERTVWLEKGEAWFRVAHNAANPFTVIVGKHRVTDLGTEFFVRRGTDGMEVGLLNGRAALSTEGAQTAMLNPGDDAIATRIAMSVTRKTPQELADALAWQRGMLVFHDTRLADAVREFNRYNQTRLVIADPSIADLKVTAEIRTDNYDGFLLLAEDVLNLRVERAGNEILISRGPREKTGRSVHTRHD